MVDASPTAPDLSYGAINCRLWNRSILEKSQGLLDEASPRDLCTPAETRVSLIHPFPVVSIFTETLQICHFQNDFFFLWLEYCRMLWRCPGHGRLHACGPLGHHYDILCWYPAHMIIWHHVVTKTVLFCCSLTKMSLFQLGGFLLHLKMNE